MNLAIEHLAKFGTCPQVGESRREHRKVPANRSGMRFLATPKNGIHRPLAPPITTFVQTGPQARVNGATRAIGSRMARALAPLSTLPQR